MGNQDTVEIATKTLQKYFPKGEFVSYGDVGAVVRGANNTRLTKNIECVVLYAGYSGARIISGWVSQVAILRPYQYRAKKPVVEGAQSDLAYRSMSLRVGADPEGALLSSLKALQDLTEHDKNVLGEVESELAQIISDGSGKAA